MKLPLVVVGAMVLVGCSHPPGASTPGFDEPPQPHGITKDPKALPLMQITLICQPGTEDAGYALTLDYTGAATYLGGAKNPVRQGKQIARFDRSKFETVRKLIETSHFADMDSYYGSADRKMPTTTVSILWNGLRKSVIDRGGSEHEAPKAIKDIKDVMEDAVATSKWTLIKPVIDVPEFLPQYDTLPPSARK